jgi:hypothetical protein
MRGHPSGFDAQQGSREPTVYRYSLRAEGQGRAELLIRQRWPALGRPLRPGRIPWRDCRDLSSAQFLQVRRLELHLPLLQFSVAHLELTQLGLVPIGDASALLPVVNRQVDDLSADA